MTQFSILNPDTLSFGSIDFKEKLTKYVQFIMEQPAYYFADNYLEQYREIRSSYTSCIALIHVLKIDFSFYLLPDSLEIRVKFPINCFDNGMLKTKLRKDYFYIFTFQNYPKAKYGCTDVIRSRQKDHEIRYGKIIDSFILETSHAANIEFTIKKKLSGYTSEFFDSADFEIAKSIISKLALS